MSSTTAAASNLFIDLATFAELEGFLYGGPNAITWFVSSVQKSNWFSYIPIQLRHTGNVDFGQNNVSASVNRSGDYVLSIWFHAQIPLIWLPPAVNGVGVQNNASLRWTHNLMHNLFQKVTITFNELTVQEFDNFWLDFNFQFRVRGSKRLGYRNIIGDIAALTTPVPPGQALGTGDFYSTIFPFWFGEDSGVALPVAALPFNDIKLNYNFRNWQELVVVYPGLNGNGGNRCATVSDVYLFNSTSQRPTLQVPTTFAHYAVVHNDERVKMGDAPRDILIHQIQEAQIAPFKDLSSVTSFDIRFSHSIVIFCFAAQNTSIASVANGSSGVEWSNYTTVGGAGYAPNPGSGLDPISFSSLLYENTLRVGMTSDYYSLIQPYYFSDAIPDETGYHMWSYALHPWDTAKPSASTNYSKLANVSIQHTPSLAAQQAAGIGTGGVPIDISNNGLPIVWANQSGTVIPMPLTLNHIFIARNWNIARVANGSLGHPTL